MAQPIMDENNNCCRINTRITREASDLLAAAVVKRSRVEPRACTLGTVVTELILDKFGPAGADLTPVPVPAPVPVTEPEPEPEPEPEKVPPKLGRGMKRRGTRRVEEKTA